MKDLTIGVFGNREFINELGKKGTVNDIAIHHHSDSEHNFTFVTPNSEKIQPLLQALQMIDVPILVIDELNAQIGEEIVGIDEMQYKKVFVVLDEFYEDQFKKVVKGTTLEKVEIIDKKVADIFTKLMNIDIDKQGDVLVPIDNYFNVKSIGTVVLGIVRKGVVRRFDKLIIEPLGKEVVIKSIQIQDRNFDHAEAGSRVGICIKGVESDEIRRGHILCKYMQKTKILHGPVQKNRFYKNEIKDNEQVIVSSGLQCVTGAIKGNDIILEKDIAIQEPIIIASTRQELLRIIGKIRV